MNMIFCVGHPAHVHFFKHTIVDLEKRGHRIKILARNKEMTLQLLDSYGLGYEYIGKIRKGIYGKVYEALERDYRLLGINRRFKPDIFISKGYLMSPIVKKLINKPFLSFIDSEHNKVNDLLVYRTADVICTPSCFRKDIGKKHIRIDGYHELAYLHPNYFKPDPSVLSELGLSKDVRFIIIRFVSWDASHDIGQIGFDRETKRKLVTEIGKYGRILITSESPLSEEFEQYRISLGPEKIHDLLYYATMYIGEGGTMATEAAVLGTPSIYVSSLVGTMGNFIELEESYGIINSFQNAELAICRATELLQQPNLKQVWARKREKLLTDKIDVAQSMVELIENLSKSRMKVKEDDSGVSYIGKNKIK